MPKKREPLVLAGPPSRLSGRLTVTNRTAERRTVRREPIVGTDVEAAGTISAIVLPRTTSEVSVRASVGEKTPPGRYHAVVNILGEARPVELVVAEQSTVTIDPDRVELRAGAGPVATRVRVTGAGNVASKIEVPATIRLERFGLRQLLGEGPTEDAPTVAVSAKPASLALEPGQSALIGLRLEPPTELDARHVGRVALSGAAFRVVVEPGEPTPTARRTPRPRKRS
jgi:hypothetical protein